MGVPVILELPEQLVAEAQAAGLLNNERISVLLRMELEREAAWNTLRQAADLLRSATREIYGELSEEDIRQMVDEEIHQMRHDNQGEGHGLATPSTKINPTP